MSIKFINSNNLIDDIFKYNKIDEKDLNKTYDFNIKDEVFLKFKRELDNLKDKKFLIVGDFDFDGIAATTIIKKLLDDLKIENNYYIPSRIKEGYGLNDSIIQKAIDYSFDCLFLVDNGIAFNDLIIKAKKNNIKVFIIDHHEYEILPDCFLIHPNIIDEKYKNLSAGGLTFLFSLLYRYDDLSLALSGISTLSDMMKVIGFNRYLIKEMYEKVNSIKQFVLLNDLKSINYDDIIFNIIPKVNSISRMEPLSNPNLLVRFFLDEEFAFKYIDTINYVNGQRKLCTKDMAFISSKDVNNNDDYILSISDSYKEGLCGLLANRLLNEHHKTSIVLAENENEYKGSIRSLNDINAYELFKDFKHYNAYGGHFSAVGLSIKKDKINEFKEYINNLDLKSEEEDSIAYVLNVDSIDETLINKIDSLKPFGEGFKMPLVAIENNDYKKIILKDKYSKYIIRNDLSCITFNENYKEIVPKYFIGQIKKDSYSKHNLSFIIEELI